MLWMTFTVILAIKICATNGQLFCILNRTGPNSIINGIYPGMGQSDNGYNLDISNSDYLYGPSVWAIIVREAQYSPSFEDVTLDTYVLAFCPYMELKNCTNSLYVYDGSDYVLDNSTSLYATSVSISDYNDCVAHYTKYDYYLNNTRIHSNTTPNNSSGIETITYTIDTENDGDTFVGELHNDWPDPGWKCQPRIETGITLNEFIDVYFEVAWISCIAAFIVLQCCICCVGLNYSEKFYECPNSECGIEKYSIFDENYENTRFYGIVAQIKIIIKSMYFGFVIAILANQIKIYNTYPVCWGSFQYDYILLEYEWWIGSLILSLIPSTLLFIVSFFLTESVFKNIDTQGSFCYNVKFYLIKFLVHLITELLIAATGSIFYNYWKFGDSYVFNTIVNLYVNDRSDEAVNDWNNWIYYDYDETSNGEILCICDNTSGDYVLWMVFFLFGFCCCPCAPFFAEEGGLGMICGLVVAVCFCGGLYVLIKTRVEAFQDKLEKIQSLGISYEPDFDDALLIYCLSIAIFFVLLELGTKCKKMMCKCICKYIKAKKNSEDQELELARIRSSSSQKK